MGIGESVKAIRQARGITQDELAKRIGVTRSQISNIEKGRRGTSLERLNEIAEALKCNVSDFYHTKEELEVDNERWVVFGRRMEEKGYTLEQLEEWIKVAESFDKTRHKND